MNIRKTTPADHAAILALYPRAFPDEDLTGIVTNLLGRADVLSLMAEDDGVLTGHILFTTCHTEGAAKGALLAPLAVDPDHQRRGIGSALVADGFARLARDNVAQVFVLGDPAYYSRLGFAPEREIDPPYPMPLDWADAWQSISLAGRARLPKGALQLPAPWMDPALWGP